MKVVIAVQILWWSSRSFLLPISSHIYEVTAICSPMHCFFLKSFLNTNHYLPLYKGYKMPLYPTSCIGVNVFYKHYMKYSCYTQQIVTCTHVLSRYAATKAIIVPNSIFMFSVMMGFSPPLLCWYRWKREKIFLSCNFIDQCVMSPDSFPCNEQIQHVFSRCIFSLETAPKWESILKHVGLEEGSGFFFFDETTIICPFSIFIIQSAVTLPLNKIFSLFWLGVEFLNFTQNLIEVWYTVRCSEFILNRFLQFFKIFLHVVPTSCPCLQAHF